MPMKAPSSTVQACSKAIWPTVTSCADIDEYDGVNSAVCKSTHSLWVYH